MPVYSSFTHPSTAFYLLWKIEEALEALYLQLPPQFLADFDRDPLFSKDRMRQYLAVRVALSCLLQKLALPILPLSKNPQGRPVLGDGIFHISFAHTRYLAAVALSTAFPIGIDVELVKPSLHRVQERFLKEKEKEAAHNCLEKLAIYWSAKEALYKRLDQAAISSFKDIFIEPFPLHNQGELVAHCNGKKYEMGYEQMGDRLLALHVLVYCKD
ncbi:4'-phosphopantetheinyl transferase superfamily protein [Cardinium endosymbiont of Nabis limbatus]|uniref:4'-phosphopantetheinyl transferase superfamily protein n=1 Tax=Cardinium endosymbiont of Nabis limbatus TaxID=3066217 RepID=UPI003AF3B1E6